MNTPLTLQLTIGQKLTIIGISEFMAQTCRKQIIVTSVLAEPIRCGYQSELLRVGTYKFKGKRKEFYLDVKPHDFVFDGWETPFMLDSERPAISECGLSVTRWSGNACYNLSGDADKIREFLTTKNLNPIFKQSQLGAVLLSPESGSDDGEQLFPDVEIHHAVIDRIKATV